MVKNTTNDKLMVTCKVVQLQQEDSRILAFQRHVWSRYHTRRIQSSLGKDMWVHTQMYILQPISQSKCNTEEPPHKETIEWWLQVQAEIKSRYTGWDDDELGLFKLVLCTCCETEIRLSTCQSLRYGNSKSWAMITSITSPCSARRATPRSRSDRM